MDLNSNKENSNKNNNQKITLDKIIGEGIDLKNSPFLYLLQIATDEKKLNKNRLEKINNNSYSLNNISLYGETSTDKNKFVSQDIDIYIREIVEKNDNKFLNGDENIFEHLIAKYLNIDKDTIPQQEDFTLKIDLHLDEYNFLNEFGIKMPNLINLNLTNSILKTIMNIGTSFKNLKILNVNNCHIEEIEGIVCFPSLETLLASDNKISDLFELSYLSNLKHLEIHNNEIFDIENIDFINMFAAIEYINISNNPIIKQINKKILNENFSIKKIENNQNEHLNKFIERDSNFDNFSLEEFSKKEGKSFDVILKSNKSKIVLFSSKKELMIENDNLFNTILDRCAENIKINENNLECVKYQRI